MKKIYQVLMCASLLIIALQVNAQERFERRYPVISSSVTTNSLAAVGSGYAILGIEVNEEGEKENINLTFLDKKGTITNSLSIFYDDTLQIKSAGEVIRLEDGTFVISAVLAKDSLNKVITRLDGFGNIFWTVITGVESDLESLISAPAPILEVPGERIFHAHVISAGASANDIQFTGIDYEGNIEFIRRLNLQDANNNSLNERFVKMHLAKDSTIMILGTTDSPDAPVFLTKMDTSGNIIWTRSYNGAFNRTLDSEGYDLAQLIDETWVILGSVKPNNVQNHGGFLMKVDKNGSLMRTEAFNSSSNNFRLYPNGIVGTLDTSVIVGLKRYDILSDTVQPMIFKYDLDSIINYQTLLDTVISENLSNGGLVTVDSMSVTYLATTIKDGAAIPYLAKVDDMGHTNCDEPVLTIVIDSVDFVRDTLSMMITEMMVSDSITADADGFGRYDPPVLILSDTTYCPQDPINYFVDATVRGGISYVWDDGNMDSTRTFTEEGMYMVTVTVIEDICFTLCDTLTISQLDFPQVAISKNFVNFCSTGIGRLTADFMGASIQSFQWSTGSTDQAIIVDGIPMQYSVTVTDGCGNSAEATVSVSESDYLQPNPLGLSPDAQNLCVDGSINIRAAAQTMPSLITWSTGATNTLSISVNAPGTYTADVGGFCPDSESITLNEDDFVTPVNAEIIFECANPAILRVIGTGFFGQTWTTGETTSTIGIREPGTYQVTLIDECGIENTSTEPIVVTADDIDACTSCDIPCLIWPNAFQPMSSDEDNTIFSPKLKSVCSTGLASFELQIYNRWGKNIFTSTDVNVGWNGDVNGDPQPGGLYFYWSRYNDGLTTCERRGDVTLLR